MIPLFRKFFRFFVFSSLFIAVCALLMVYQTTLLFHIPFHWTVAGFVFCGTVCSYNFHWYLTPPDTETKSKKLSWNISNRAVHLSLFIAALAGSAVFTILLLPHWFWLGTTAVLTFLYSAPKIPFPAFSFLKKVAIGKTIFLAFAWAHVTSLLPILIHFNKLDGAGILFFINRFFFIYAICILFDFRDQEEDRKAGIRSLITYLNEKGIDLLFWSGMLVSLVTNLLLLQYFSWTVVIALLIPLIILSLLYYPSKRNFSDYLYYFVLDGLMMLSSPLLLLFTFAR